LSDLGAELVRDDQDGEVGDRAEGIASSLRILELTADVRVAVTEELGLIGVLVHAEHLDIDLGDRSSSVLVDYLQLTKVRDQVELQLVPEELLEFGLTRA